MKWNEYDPASLPPVNKVEVVHLRGVWETQGAVSLMQEAKSAPRLRLNADLAQEAAELWRQLQPAKQMRCHNSVYGLRFYRRNDLILQASVCWECNNIFLDEPNNEKSGYEFDASHPHAQRLLQICREAMDNLEQNAA